MLNPPLLRNGLSHLPLLVSEVLHEAVQCGREPARGLVAVEVEATEAVGESTEKDLAAIGEHVVDQNPPGLALVLLRDDQIAVSVASFRDQPGLEIAQVF